MKIQAFEVPYDSGRFQERLGLGPAALTRSGLINRLRFLGHEVSIDRIRLGEIFTSEIQNAFALAGELSHRVKRAHETGYVSVVLSGNCNAALGAIAGLGAARTGVLWFDAHGEFNTPETTTSGFLDGMGLAIATGACWRGMAESIYGWSRIPPENVILAGVRDTDPPEQELLDRSGIQQAPAVAIHQSGVRAVLSPAVHALQRRVEFMYVHFDLDVLDPSVARWNAWSTPGGLMLDQIEDAVELLAGGPPLAALGFASYEPELDPEASYEAARKIIDKALAVAGA